MRRTDKEITDQSVLDGILAEALVCRLAMCRGSMPYLVPVNFAHFDNCLWIHSAPAGMKLDFFRENPRVCFEVDIRVEVSSGEKACSWSCKYFSIIGFGDVTFVNDLPTKRLVLQHIMRKYSGEGDWELPENSVNMLTILKVAITNMTGKKSRYETWIPGSSEGDSSL